MLVAASTVVGLGVSGCWLLGKNDSKPSAAPPAPAPSAAAATADTRPAPKLCAAVRGNGNLILTHFTSLARLAEHYGPFDGMAGGSSASVTTFLYESMLMHPALRDCGGHACSTDERSLRLSLLLKSVQRYLTYVVTETDEALAVRGLAPIAARVEAEGIEALLDVSPLEAARKLHTILSSPDLKSLVNAEVLSMLTEGPNLARNAREVYEAVTAVGKFSSDDPRILFRPGVLDFAGLADKVGRVGSFYAGYGPYDAAATEAFLAACAPGSRGLSFAELAARKLAAGGGETTCGAAFDALVRTWRGKLLAGEASFRSRIDDLVGGAFHAAVATAVLTGDTRRAFDESLARFRAGEPLGFSPRFTEVRYGYFGEASDVARIEADAAGYADLKSRKAMALPQAPWREVLALSPAEPGLARVQPFGDGLASAAGWVDLHPVQALRSLGCERVVYVTREGEDSKFSQGVARLLGATDADVGAIYSLDAPDSGFSVALRDAAGVWCTRWDSFADDQFDEMSAEAYAAPLETRDAFFAAGADGMPPYAGRVEKTNRRGCTKGAAP